MAIQVSHANNAPDVIRLTCASPAVWFAFSYIPQVFMIDNLGSGGAYFGFTSGINVGSTVGICPATSARSFNTSPGQIGSMWVMGSGTGSAEVQVWALR